MKLPQQIAHRHYASGSCSSHHQRVVVGQFALHPYFENYGCNQQFSKTTTFLRLLCTKILFVCHPNGISRLNFVFSHQHLHNFYFFSIFPRLSCQIVERVCCQALTFPDAIPASNFKKCLVCLRADMSRPECLIRSGRLKIACGYLPATKIARLWVGSSIR
jgi:hypothetical protein